MGDGYFVVPVQSIRLSTSHLYLTKSQEFQQVTATAVPATANNTGIKLTSGITWHDDGQTRYYDLNGRPVGTRPTIQGVYIKVEHGKRTKVTVQ